MCVPKNSLEPILRIHGKICPQPLCPSMTILKDPMMMHITYTSRGKGIRSCRWYRRSELGWEGGPSGPPGRARRARTSPQLPWLFRASDSRVAPNAARRTPSFNPRAGERESDYWTFCQGVKQPPRAYHCFS